MADMFPPIDVAALGVVTSLDALNLAEGDSEKVLVWRRDLLALREALEESYPGVINRMYKIKRDQERQAS